MPKRKENKTKKHGNEYQMIRALSDSRKAKLKGNAQSILGPA
jgi:hypothetical protein